MFLLTLVVSVALKWLSLSVSQRQRKIENQRETVRDRDGQTDRNRDRQSQRGGDCVSLLAYSVPLEWLLPSERAPRCSRGIFHLNCLLLEAQCLELGNWCSQLVLEGYFSFEMLGARSSELGSWCSGIGARSSELGARSLMLDL